jgi:hypothetical protein
MTTQRSLQFSVVLTLGLLQMEATAAERPAPRPFLPSAPATLTQQAQSQAKPLAPLASLSPATGDACKESDGANVKVSQNCVNLSDPDLQGDGQASNATAIAHDPIHPNHLVAVSNDYRRGDTACTTHYSLDGGDHWRDSTPPLGFTRGIAFFGGVDREYWQASGDASVAWDTKGNVYMVCGVLPAGGFESPFIGANFSTADLSTAVYVFRSTLNNGASWNFPARAVVEQSRAAATSCFPCEWKPQLTVDNHVGSPFQDRIYVTWTEFLADGSVYVWERFSDNYGESFSPRVLVSGSNPALCALNPFNSGTPQGACNASELAQPFTGPDGTLYMVFENFNNSYAPQPSNCPGFLSPGNTNPCDNHNQLLLAKSTDGGVSFSVPVKVADFYGAPDCATYQGGQNFGWGCLPEKGASMNSVFRVIDYPVGAVDPKHPNTVVVTFPSHINVYSNETNGCIPQGAATGQNLYTGVKTPGACSHHILLSVSKDGGATFTGGAADVRSLPTINQAQGQSSTDQWFQWAAFTRSGALVVSYYDRSYGNDEVNGSMDISISWSGEGRQFHTARVTSSSMPPPTQFAGTYMGDYSGLTAADDAHPVWTDTRDRAVFVCPGTGQPGVPPTLCNMTTPGGVTSNNQEIFTSSLSLD